MNSNNKINKVKSNNIEKKIQPQLEPIPKNKFDFIKFNGDYLPDDIPDFHIRDENPHFSIEQQMINEAIQRSLNQK